LAEDDDLRLVRQIRPVVWFPLALICGALTFVAGPLLLGSASGTVPSVAIVLWWCVIPTASLLLGAIAPASKKQHEYALPLVFPAPIVAWLLIGLALGPMILSGALLLAAVAGGLAYASGVVGAHHRSLDRTQRIAPTTRPAGTRE
jgi:hypothetical protein